MTKNTMNVEVEVWACTGNGCQMEKLWEIKEVIRWKNALPVVAFEGQQIRCASWRFCANATEAEKAEIFKAIGADAGTIGTAFAQKGQP